VFATDAISKGRLPAEMKDRDRFVGVRLVHSGRKGRYFQARFSIKKTLLSEIGKPKRVSIRGTPQNGYIISAGDDLKLTILNSSSVAHLSVSAERVNMPRDERAVIWIRSQIEKNILRIPPLPPAWISGQSEFLPKDAPRPQVQRKVGACPSIGKSAPQGWQQSCREWQGRLDNFSAAKEDIRIPAPRRHVARRRPGAPLAQARRGASDHSGA